MKKTLHKVTQKYLTVEDRLISKGLPLAEKMGVAHHYQRSVNSFRDTRNDVTVKTLISLERKLKKAHPQAIKHQAKTVVKYTHGKVKAKVDKQVETVVDAILYKTLGHNLKLDFDRDFMKELY